MRVDTDLLSSIYMERLQSLRGRAEESGISKSGSVEVRMETLSPDGRKTLSLERLVAMSEYQRAIVALLIDWENMVMESSREVPKDHPDDDDAPSFL